MDGTEVSDDLAVLVRGQRSSLEEGLLSASPSRVTSLKDDQLLSPCVCVFASCLILLLHTLGCRDNTAS